MTLLRLGSNLLRNSHSVRCKGMFHNESCALFSICVNQDAGCVKETEQNEQ